VEKLKIDPSMYLRVTTKARNEREEIIENIREQLNKGREGTKYKPLTFVAVKLKITHLDDWDLKFFYDKCKKAKSFGGCFFGELKKR
jgi:hypothetical protein